jgi:hypothetical protein
MINGSGKVYSAYEKTFMLLTEQFHSVYRGIIIILFLKGDGCLKVIS